MNGSGGHEDEISDKVTQHPAAGGLLALQDLEQSLVGGAECDQAAGGWSGAALHQPSHQSNLEIMAKISRWRWPSVP